MNAHKWVSNIGHIDLFCMILFRFTNILSPFFTIPPAFISRIDRHTLSLSRQTD